jgi:amino acid transporter
MADEGVLPRPFALVHERRRTPVVAILFTTLIAVVLVSTTDLAKLADTTVALLVVVFGIVNVTVLVLRRDRVEHEHFRVPSIVPVIGVGVSIALLTQIEGEVYARAAILIAIGVLLWAVNAWLVRRERSASPPNAA